MLTPILGNISGAKSTLPEGVPSTSIKISPDGHTVYTYFVLKCHALLVVLLIVSTSTFKILPSMW